MLRAVGIRASVRTTPVAQRVQLLNQGKVDISYFGWSGGSMFGARKRTLMFNGYEKQVAALYAGNVAIVSVYAMQLLAAQHAAPGTEAFWLGAAAMGLAISSVVALPLWGRVLDRYAIQQVRCTECAFRLSDDARGGNHPGPVLARTTN